MKLAFSTLGCPRWSFDDTLTIAKDLGYDSIEIRGVDQELYAPNIKAFNKDNIDKTIERLNSLNLKICMLTSGASLAVYDKKEAALAEAKAYIDLAKKLNAPYVRVMCTDQPQPDGGDIKLCKRLYAELLEYGDKNGVTPLMETNGMFSNTYVLAEFLAGFDGVGGALWDINHPYRFAGEAIETTLKNLDGKIKHVHLKDSVVQNGGTAYKMLGQGDIPIKQAVSLLNAKGYDGVFSLEWVKRWNQNLEEPGIVFSHFVSFMRSL